MGVMEQKELLWCLVCNEKFSIEDVSAGRYEAETGICTSCYKRMARDEKTCFGEETSDARYGYDEKTFECRDFCPDRRICKAFVQGWKRKSDVGGVPEEEKND